MAQITINDKLSVKGNVTFNRVVNEDKTGFIIEGILLTHLYFDDIKILSTSRYRLTGVEVYQEAFGSDDYNIGYYFRCDDIEILGQESDGAKFILYPSEMAQIEEVMYKDEHPILGGVGAQYKDMVKKEEEESSEGSEK